MYEQLSYEEFDALNSALYAQEDFDTNVYIKAQPGSSRYTIYNPGSSCVVFDAVYPLEDVEFSSYEQALAVYNNVRASLIASMQLKDKDTMGTSSVVQCAAHPLAGDDDSDALLASYVTDEEMAEVYNTMYGSHSIEKTQEEIDKEYQDRLWKAIKEGSR
jgi:hypothetical protein